MWRRVVECGAELSSVAQTCRVWRRVVECGAELSGLDGITRDVVSAGTVSAGTWCQPGRRVSRDGVSRSVSVWTLYLPGRCQPGRGVRRDGVSQDVVSGGTVSAAEGCVKSTLLYLPGRCQPGRGVRRDGVNGRCLREVDAVVTATPTVCV